MNCIWHVCYVFSFPSLPAVHCLAALVHCLAAAVHCLAGCCCPLPCWLLLSTALLAAAVHRLAAAVHRLSAAVCCLSCCCCQPHGCSCPLSKCCPLPVWLLLSTAFLAMLLLSTALLLFSVVNHVATGEHGRQWLRVNGEAAQCSCVVPLAAALLDWCSSQAVGVAGKAHKIII